MVLERIKEFFESVYQGILNEKEFFGYWDREHKIWKKDKGRVPLSS
jgi:hypothetical protein